jgi:hypothetical protein
MGYDDRQYRWHNNNEVYRVLGASERRFPGADAAGRRPVREGDRMGFRLSFTARTMDGFLNGVLVDRIEGIAADEIYAGIWLWNTMKVRLNYFRRIDAGARAAPPVCDGRVAAAPPPVAPAAAVMAPATAGPATTVAPVYAAAAAAPAAATAAAATTTAELASLRAHVATLSHASDAAAASRRVAICICGCPVECARRGCTALPPCPPVTDAVFLSKIEELESRAQK